MILRRPPFFLLDDIVAGRARLFRRPRETIRARRADEVAPALARIEAGLAAGYHAAGWIAFEAAAGLEPRLARAFDRLPAEPLLCFGLFGPPEILDRASLAAAFAAASGGTSRRAVLGEAEHEEDAACHAAGLARIAGLIAAGDVYQINHTWRVRRRLDGDPVALYERLRRAQPVPFGALIDDGERHILSLSPELFVESRGGRLTTRPMKGTARRGRDDREDARLVEELAGDPKTRAENLMIVDLLRNDLARVAEPGSVEVPALFEVERHPTLLQMTSTVAARRRADCGLAGLIAALFPCGSVTGAPKLRAIERIAGLEASPRGIYTGAIGHAEPGGDLCFSVAIRTLTVDRDGEVRYGVGGGIVADSTAAAEYAEGRLKARFLDCPVPPFSLVETLGWHPGEGPRRGERHLARLAASAAELGFACDIDALRREAEALCAGLDRPTRLRLLLARDGATALVAAPLVTPNLPLRLALAETPPAPPEPEALARRRHKTTDRAWCEVPLADARARGFDEVLFFNDRGEATEGARGNLFLERDGCLLTPPLACGLLPGILRAELLESGRAREAVLRREDIAGAGRLFMGSSLHGLMPARLAAP